MHVSEAGKPWIVEIIPGKEYQGFIYVYDSAGNRFLKKKKIKETTEKKAEKRAEEWRDKLVSGRIPHELRREKIKAKDIALKQQMTLPSFFESVYKPKLLTDNSPFTTIDHWEKHILKHLECISDLPIIHIDDAAINETLKESLSNKIKGNKLSPATANGILRRVKTLLKYAKKKKIIKDDPPDIEYFKLKAKKQKIPLTDSDVKKALEKYEYNVIMRSVILLGCHAAMRRGEIAGLTWEHVHLEPVELGEYGFFHYGYLEVVQQKDVKNNFRETKGHTKTAVEINTIIPLTKELQETLKKNRQKYPRSKLVIIHPKLRTPIHVLTLNKWFKKAFGDQTTHKMRAYALTNLEKRGVSLKIIQQIARHANIQTTLGYFTYNKSELSSVATI